MPSERINIYYHGQELTLKEKARIKADVSYNLGSAPSDASACLCVYKESEGYACNLRVHSASGHILIHKEGKDLKTMLNHLYTNMERSFKNWHQDQDHFAKEHPLTHSPCYGLNQKMIECPLHYSSSEVVSSC